MKLLDYATIYDITLQPTERVAAIKLPKPVMMSAFIEQVATRYAHLDGLTVEAYVSKLILKDQYERRIASLD